jgi:nitrate reductase gamma subunit
MTVYRIISLTAFLICVINLTYHLIRLIRLGLPKDFSQKTGNIKSAVAYSFTGAMNPMQKESAYLHFPTYTAGILYHIGTFVSLALFILLHLKISLSYPVQLILVCILAVSALSGTGIFFKRLFLKKLKYLSAPDDYISNLLVTLFQSFTLFVLIIENFAPYYYIMAAILFLYLPLGKLKHSLYFFAARYHLGFFFGWRGIWPDKNEQV